MDVFNYVALCGSKSAICTYLNEPTEIGLVVLIRLNIKLVEMCAVNSHVCMTVCIGTRLCVCAFV